jgi:hypothetical protein
LAPLGFQIGWFSVKFAVGVGVGEGIGSGTGVGVGDGLGLGDGLGEGVGIGSCDVSFSRLRPASCPGIAKASENIPIAPHTTNADIRLLNLVFIFTPFLFGPWF